MDIASQLYWVSLLLEVMEEALIFPLYHCIGAPWRCCRKLLRACRRASSMTPPRGTRRDGDARHVWLLSRAQL